MGRSRLPLELIAKEKSRKITFQKRTNGLKKKTLEISTLCEVDACVIIYNWKAEDRPGEPIFWPEEPEKVKAIINRYKEHSKEERGLKSLDLSGFFEDRTKRIHKEISKMDHQNADQSKYPTWDDRLYDLSLDQLRELMNAWDAKLDAIKSKVEYLKIHQPLLDGSALGNPNCPTNAVLPPTQSLHVPYLGGIESMPLLPNPMTPLMNSRMAKVMMTLMTSDTSSGSQYGGPSNYNPQYTTAPLQHPFYYDPTSGMLENIVYSNPGTSSCYYPPSLLPPMLPYIPNQMVSNVSQITRSYDRNEMGVNDNNQCIRFG